SATSQMLSDLAFALAERGWAVQIITSRRRYDAPAERLAPRQLVRGVTVHRIWTSRFGRAKLLGRAIDYATFYLSAAWCLWRLAKAGDVVVVKTDPPMLSIMAAPMCWLRRVRFVNWLQDLFPEAAEALGVGGRAARAGYAVLRRLRNRSLKAAYTNVVLGERMAGRLADLCISENRVHVISNWADGSVITPAEHVTNRLRSDWGLTGEFVVAYSGNLGRAHDIDTLLDAMSILEQEKRTVASDCQEQQRPVSWLFIGGGALT